MAFRSPKVIIIGGGIAGPVLALALKQRNISSIVFELRPHSIRREGGYFALAPNVLRVLRSIGVYDEIRSQGYNYEGLDFLSSRNLAVLGRVQNGSLKHYGFEALRVSRHLVRQALLVELLRQGIEIRYDSKCIQITEDDIYLQEEEEEEEEAGRYGGVTVEFANGHVERGDFVVGADGIHSSVRKYIDPAGESEPQFTRLMGVGGTVHRSRLSALRPDMSLPCLILGKDNSFAMMPATNDGSEIGFFATIEEEERSRDTWAELGSDKEYLSKVLKERHSADNTSWPEVVRQVCLEMPSESLTVWPFYKIPPLHSYCSPSGRVILIGDAAHALPPTGGQGAAMALEDAGTLANALALSVEDSPGISSAQVRETLHKWQTHRRERIRKITAFSSQGGDMRRPTANIVLQVLKEWAMRAIFWWAGSVERMKWIYSYDIHDALQ